MGACVLGNVFVIMVVWVLVAVLVASAVGRMVNQLLLTRLPRGVLRIAVGVAVSFFLVNLVLLWLSQASFARTPWWALFPGGLFANAMVLKRLWDAVGADAASAKPFVKLLISSPHKPTPGGEQGEMQSVDVAPSLSAGAGLADGIDIDEQNANGVLHRPSVGLNTAARPVAQRVKSPRVILTDDKLRGVSVGKPKKNLFGSTTRAEPDA
jgi:hypothetical protein